MGELTMQRILFPALLIALIAVGVTSRLDVDIDFLACGQNTLQDT